MTKKKPAKPKKSGKPKKAKSKKVEKPKEPNYIIKAFKEVKKTKGKKVYESMDEVFALAEVWHKEAFDKNENTKDRGQSWRSYKGKNFEGLIEHLLTAKIKSLGLKLVNGNKLEHTASEELSEELASVKKNVLIDYGKYGFHFPDADLIIYKPDAGKVIAIISMKITLRERIAETGYWSIKLRSQPTTKHIKRYFVTPDRKTLQDKNPMKKGRVIAETEMDGTYVLGKIETSDKVRYFTNFIDDFTAYVSKMSNS